MWTKIDSIERQAIGGEKTLQLPMDGREPIERELAAGDPALVGDNNQPVTRRGEQLEPPNGARKELELLRLRNVFTFGHFPVEHAIAVQESGAPVRSGDGHLI